MSEDEIKRESPWFRWRRQDGYLSYLIVSLMAIYIITVILSLAWGVAFLDNKSGFLQKENWYLIPIFLVILTFLVRCSWHPFIAAWRDFPSSSVIKYRDSDEYLNEKIIEQFIDELKRWRKYAGIITLIVGVFLTYLELSCLIEQYASDENLCINPESSCYQECDFSVAYIVYPGSISYNKNLSFNIFAYALQCGQGFCGIFSLVQLLIHTVGFMLFESFRTSKKYNLVLKLNIHDRLKEFGLSRWNWAINYGYGIMALGMIPPVISAWANRGKPPDEGQLILQIIIPIILIIPIGFAVFGRFNRFPVVQREARQNDELTQLLDENKLWPFDKHRIGKLFIAIAVIEYTYVFGTSDLKGIFELILTII